jgi:hypothetical protein
MSEQTGGRQFPGQADERNCTSTAPSEMCGAAIGGAATWAVAGMSIGPAVVGGAGAGGMGSGSSAETRLIQAGRRAMRPV